MKKLIKSRGGKRCCFYKNKRKLEIMNDKYTLKEIEANQFAVAILMPRHLIKSEIEKIKDNKMSKAIITKLAKTFGVTYNIMLIRLYDLNYITPMNLTI